ncbi:glycoside hydrolase family 38 protein [Gigaspora margarita]|uniref:Alpha-mannosidase n=1 Tax=Gigaspora margarita TaxID=4874 RepID=A0A8H4A266_GIGMA|nr:glycoside hydrolase family 38 protein [Gigaspora margarita]
MSSYPRVTRNITIERCEKFLSRDFFSDVNLYSQLYKNRTGSEEYIKLSVYNVPDLKRITFEEAVKAVYKPAKCGDTFGPSWSTHWFHITVRVPDDWINEEVQFLWDSSSEGMIWTKDGTPLQGLTGGYGNDRRAEYVLTRSSNGGEQFEFYLEMACNGMFGNGIGSDINPPDPNRYYSLRQVELAIPNQSVWQLMYDFQIILDMAKEIPHDTMRSAQALNAANKIVNTFQPSDNNSIQEALKISNEFLKHKNGSTQYTLTAVGHCHIDTAWLWPYDETKRKVARSWSTQVGLMDLYPEYKFVCSQAQQFEWLKEYYPKLFKKVQDKSANDQFLPIGGTWVEMDCNIPSGEAFCRQFLYGQRFFEKNFGHKCKVFWLPDTFGYSAQLPQIIIAADLQYFFTQKLSWNNINKFPNTTFYWVGLDGSKVLTHMCPSETYVAQCKPDELIRSVRNNRDKELNNNEGLLVFGNGDGGGGPLASMIERLRRLKDIDGLAKVNMGSADEFYERLEKNSSELVSWKGELYFELHRGTYTSHGKIKRYNRKSELLLRDVEMLHSFSLIDKHNCVYPKDQLDKMWKYVLLNQFHDVLPGSSIGIVYDDANKFYQEVENTGTKLLEDALDTLLKISATASSPNKGFVVFNTLGWHRTEIVKVPVCNGLDTLAQYAEDKKSGYVLVKDTVGMGSRNVNIQDSLDVTQVTACKTDDDCYCLENQFITAKFNRHGHLFSLVDRKLNREIIPTGQYGNLFKLYEDIPLFWDAWDVEIYHLQKGRDVGLGGTVKIIEQGPLRSALLLETNLSETSKLYQMIVLTSVSPRLDFETRVDWNENRQFLKVEFPFDIYSDFATYETQFGFIQRPTHYNTSWDTAKFEVCGHKFADLSEYGYGVALLNDCKYGYATHGNVMRLSLLRSPKAPDKYCDIGVHEFKYALLPHTGTFLESNVVREAYQFNVPLIVRATSKEIALSHGPKSYFTVEGAPNVILDTVKRAEDSDEIVLRLYEAFGGHATAKLQSSFSFERLYETNILEDKQIKIDYHSTEGAIIKFKPFQFITLKATLRTEGVRIKFRQNKLNRKKVNTLCNGWRFWSKNGIVSKLFRRRMKTKKQ